MATKTIFTTFLFFLLGPALILCHAQVIIKQDSTAEFDKSKGIIAIIPAFKGSFYMNDYYLTEIKGNDTIFLINVKPGDYQVKFLAPSGPQQKTITVNKRKVVEVIPGKDSLISSTNVLKWYSTTDRIAGKPFYFLLKNYVYTIIQFSAINYQWWPSSSESSFTYLNTITAITGYQVSQGFCVGLGLSYHIANVPSVRYGYGFDNYNLENVSYLPVFFDLRIHLSDRRVVPFFNFGVGYSLLLTKKSVENVQNYDPSTTVINTMEATSGGFHFSAGFGMRIAISKFIQVIPSLEYCRESGRILYTKTTLGQPTTELNEKFSQNIFRLNVGIGLQYR